MKKYTHQGILRGCDSRTPLYFKFKVKLRETKNFWITDKKTKYRKRDGSGIGDWPIYRLDLNSIISLED